MPNILIQIPDETYKWLSSLKRDRTWLDVLCDGAERDPPTDDEIEEYIVGGNR